MACSSQISQIIDQLESGGMPTVTFFSSDDCAGGQWPQDSTFWSPLQYTLPISASQICPPGLSKILCPVPAVVSMVFAPGLKIEFFGNDTAVGTTTKVKEIGKTNFYSSDPTYANTAHIKNLSIYAGVLKWYSSQCNGEPNNCNIDSGIPDNCVTKVDADNFDTDGKLLKSMISCNSQLWPSFIGINTLPYIDGTPDAVWSQCNLIPDKPVPPDSDARIVLVQDFCAQNNMATIENVAYQSVRSIVDADDNCALAPGFFQACACLATKNEAIATETRKFYNSALNTGGCNPTRCGLCIVEDDAKGLSSHNYPCTCTDDANTVRGSVKEIIVSFATSDNKQATWEELQIEWCTSGVSVAGIPITRYTSGTPTCDALMTQACSNTANITSNPNLATQCQCVNEAKLLQAQFAGVDLPSQCFSTICNISGADVYKLKSQLTGCSARLCLQTLSIHGSSLLSQGFQEVICNGQIYNVSDNITPTGDVPFVSVVPPAPYGSFVLSPVFYIAMVILILLVILTILWIIRRIRNKKRESNLAQEKFEASLKS